VLAKHQWDYHVFWYIVREDFGFRSDEYSLSNDEFHMVVFTGIWDQNVCILYNQYNWKGQALIVVGG
jgi:hypothetical protein